MGMQKRVFLLLKWPLLLLVSQLSCQLFAQPKTDTAKNAKPVFTSYLGPYSVGKALNSDIKRLMSMNPVIKVKDTKGNEYKVISYEVTWKRKEMSDDFKTGKPKTVYYMVGTDVRSNQLPESFRTQISTDIKAGEELGFTNILYTDPKKKTNYKGPDILISIL